MSHRDVAKSSSKNHNNFSVFLDRTTTIILITLIFSLPWMFSTLTQEYYEITKNLVLIILSCIMLMLWAIKVIMLKKVSLTKSPLDKSILFLTLTYLISTLFTLNSDTSIWGYHMRLTGGLISNMTLIGLFYFVINNLNDKKHIRAIVNSIPISLGIFAIFTILKSFNLIYPLLEAISSSNPDLSFLTNPLFTPAGNPNSLSTLFLIGLPYSLFLFLNKNKSSRNLKIMGFIISGVLITAISSTLITNELDISKTLTWIILGSLLFFSLIYSFKQKDKLNNTVIFNIILLIIALLGFFYSVDTTFRSRVTPQINFSRYYEIPSQTSIEIIKGTFSDNPERLVAGVGLGAYANIFPQYRPESQNLQPNWFENYTRSNLQVESILIENGIIGIITLTIFSISILKFLALDVFKAKIHQKSTLMLTLSLAGLIFLISFILTYHSITILFLSWLGLALLIKLYILYFQPSDYKFVADFNLISSTSNSKESQNNIAPKIFSLTLLIISATLIYLTTINYTAEIRYSQALRANESRDFNSAYDLVINSINLNNSRDYYHRELASIALNMIDSIMTNVNPENSAETEKTEVTQQYLQTLINSEINKAIIIDPENHENWQRASIIYKKLTELYQGKQYGGEALQAVEKAIEKNPTSPDNYLLLGYLYQYNADPEISKLAEQAYTKAYKLQPGYFLSIIQLGQYLESTEQYELALALYTVSKDEIFIENSDFNTYLSQRIEAMRNALDNNK